MDPYLHSTLNQRYRLEQFLGRGRFGAAYRASIQPVTEAKPDVCVRVFEKADPDRTAMLEAFDSLARLSVPGVLPWQELGRISTGPATGLTFLITPYGTPLSRSMPAPMAPADVEALALDLATALQGLHDASLVYLKLTPSNVVQVAGHWQLADRDTLRPLSSSWLDHYLSQADPYYVSAELWRREYLPQVDVWALGLLLLECLQGKLPGTGTGFLYDVTMASVAVPSDLPPPFDLIIRGCLQVEPGRRWSAVNVLQTLRREPVVLDTSWRSPYAAEPTWHVKTPLSGGRRLEGHVQEVRAVACPPRGMGVASGSREGSIHLWDVESGRFQRLAGHEAPIRRLAFAAEGDVLASGCRGGKVCVWDVATRAVLKTATLQVPLADLAFVKTDLLMLLDDGNLLIWNWRAGKPRPRDTWERATCFVPTGLQDLVWGRLDGQVRDGRESGRSEVVRTHRGPVASLSADKDRVFSCGLDGALVRPDGSRQSLPTELWCVANHQDTVAAAGHDRLVYVWPAKSTDVFTLKGHTLGVTGLAFSSDGRYLVSGARDRKVIVWDMTEVKA